MVSIVMSSNLGGVGGEYAYPPASSVNALNLDNLVYRSRVKKGWAGLGMMCE